MRDGVVSVRWSGTSWRPLESYLQEQIELLAGR
jgi:hypothetical protein